MKHILFPRLLEDPNIPRTDKDKITELLRKPFYPYLRRHIGITEKAREIPEHSLRLYSGWTKLSKMPEIYTHELGNEITDQILELKGIKTKSGQQRTILQSKICTNCQEPNKPEAKFCSQCFMVLTYDAYADTIEEGKKKDSEVKLLQEKHEKDMKDMREQINKIVSLIQENPKLAKVRSEVLTTL
jgi:hypothetical protein